LTWFLTVFLFFVFVPNKEARYVLLAIPALILPFSFYISKLPRNLFLISFLSVAALITCTSYSVLSPVFYYNTDYSQIASLTLQKSGNVLLAADSNSFYTSTFIFEMMRLDSSKENSVLRPCILDVKSIGDLVKQDGVRYLIVPNKPLIPTNNTLTAADIKSFQPIKTIIIKDTMLAIYENSNYIPQKENCNYVCVIGGWVCSNFTNPIDALK